MVDTFIKTLYDLAIDFMIFWKAWRIGLGK
jgi:hypothetical protein